MENLPTKPKAGRPKAGTEQDRLDALLEQSLQIFMEVGYSQTSIAKIAQVTGISTRTIYERFKNKGELMLAAVARMVESDVSKMLNTEHLERMSPQEALYAFGVKIIARIMRPQMISFYRMGVSEAMHMPEICSKMKAVGPLRIQSVVADYLAKQAAKGVLPEQDYAKAAALFCEMLIAGPRNQALFGWLESDWDAQGHIRYVVEVFLNGIDKRQLEHKAPE